MLTEFHPFSEYWPHGVPAEAPKSAIPVALRAAIEYPYATR